MMAFHALMQVCSLFNILHVVYPARAILLDTAQLHWQMRWPNTAVAHVLWLNVGALDAFPLI